MKLKIGILIAIAIVSGIVFKLKGSRSEEKKIHIHAGFLVYKDNKLEDFSDFRYMHIKPCSEGEHKENEEDKRMEKGHLHDNIGNVVHVHEDGALWADLFENIKYEIDQGASFYRNGKKVENLLNSPINAYDSVVIFIGENDKLEEKLAIFVSKERIVEVEGMSEGCGK